LPEAFHRALRFKLFRRFNACTDEVRYLKGKLLDQGRAPTFGDFLPTYNDPAAGAAVF